MAKLNTPKGTRDFLPAQMRRRQWIFSTLRKHFEGAGYAPIETPSMESLETLLGKYGEEGDRLIFKILNSGDFLAKHDADAQTSGNSSKYALSISEKALRYDLTVPFARFVAQHQNDIIFPFKRYQIQPVWRADRPQKGRYREFFQCDIDVIGSDSLLNEIEILQIVYGGFSSLGLPDVTIKVNNRKILVGLAEYLNASDRFTDLTVAVDKLDKIGMEGVARELEGRGFGQEQVKKLTSLLSSDISTENLKSAMSSSSTGKQGLEEMDFILENTKGLPVEFDLKLARGLNYYTGTIVEVVHPEFNSSICGGGRYDDLTGIFGLKDVSGVGVSFGADRIYDLLEEKGLFPSTLAESVDVVFANFGEKEAIRSLELATEMKQNGLRCLVYPDEAKMKKQFKYAEQIGAKYVAVIGSEELDSGTVTVKKLETGEQKSFEQSTLIHSIKDY